MNKPLFTILTIFKVAKIVAKVIFILSIVGGAGCMLALIALPLSESAMLASFAEEGLDLPSAYLSCIAGLVTCVGEIIVAYLAERYFGNVLSAGTPFTYDGAHESFRLGLTASIVALATPVAAGIAYGIFTIVLSTEPTFDIDTSVSLTTGLFFMFLSLIFKHGAELQEAAPSTEDIQEGDHHD